MDELVVAREGDVELGVEIFFRENEEEIFAAVDTGLIELKESVAGEDAGLIGGGAA